MIISYGEILADMIGETKDGKTSYGCYAGGAPFNVACGIKSLGGKSGFVGNIGNDIIGNFLLSFAKEKKLDFLSIDKSEEFNTTLAFVKLDENGERSFCFNRKHTADYIFSENTLNYVKDAEIVHLGSLMLCKNEGADFAVKLINEVRRQDKILSFDVNYRDDLFTNQEEAARIYKKYAREADILKLSEEETEIITGAVGVEGLKKFARKNQLICVTLGKNGSAYYLNGEYIEVPSIKVKAIDTTGAGDAFFAGLLRQLDGKNYLTMSKAELYDAFRFANIAGALATTEKGAITTSVTYENVIKYLK